MPPFADPSSELRAALIEMGRPGGMMDANDPLEVGPIRLITEPELARTIEIILPIPLA